MTWYNYILLTLTLLFAANPASNLSAEQDQCALIDKIALEVSKKRELPLLHDIKCGTYDKEAFLEKRKKLTSKLVSPEIIRNEGITFKLLGLIPEDYDYENCAVDASIEDVLAYYDTNSHEMLLPNWTETARKVLIHETVHALQDQHFNLFPLERKAIKTQDSALALGALEEGDAMFFERALKDEGGDEKRSEEESATKTNSYDRCHIPPLLQEQYDFPYGFGSIFVERLVRNAGILELNRAFGHVPRSTREILLSKDYIPLENKFFTSSLPNLPTILPPEGSKRVFVDTLGQYTIRLLLKSLDDQKEAILASKGWRGDRLGLYLAERSNKSTLLWLSLWDSEKDAKEAFYAFGKAFAKRYSVEINLRDTHSISFCRSDSQCVALGQTKDQFRVQIWSSE